MNRMRLFAVTTIALLTLAAAAQQTSGTPNSANKDHSAQSESAPSTEEHMKMLTERLDLTVEQQEKLRPIVQKMLDDRQKLISDQGLSNEQRHERLKALHEKADHEARKFLNDDQKKKLDELKAQHHPESAEHGQQ